MKSIYLSFHICYSLSKYFHFHIAYEGSPRPASWIDRWNFSVRKSRNVFGVFKRPTSPLIWLQSIQRFFSFSVEFCWVLRRLHLKFRYTVWKFIIRRNNVARWHRTHPSRFKATGFSRVLWKINIIILVLLQKRSWQPKFNNLELFIYLFQHVELSLSRQRWLVASLKQPKSNFPRQYVLQDSFGRKKRAAIDDISTFCHFPLPSPPPNRANGIFINLRLLLDAGSRP